MENTTAPTSLPADLTVETLNALNLIDGRLTRMLKDLVCELEQQSMDAERSGFDSLAQTRRDEARTTELLMIKVGTTITATFIEVLQSIGKDPTSTAATEVTLPPIPRRTYGSSGKVIPVSSTEVV